MWLNWQIPILTEGEHNNARIINMDVEKINEFLEKDGVVIIPGFKEFLRTAYTTIGRGGRCNCCC